MRLTYICSEPPYPPTNGGRSDVWGRLNAFNSNGVAIQLICWQSDRFQAVTIEQMEVLKSVVEEVIICRIGFDIPSLILRLWHLLNYSSQVASRILRKRQLEHVSKNVINFKPDAIWLDTFYGGVLAQKLSSGLQKPLFTRSQNIEHYYFRQLVVAEKKISKKIRLYLTTLHLKKYEFKILQESNLFYDISMDDLAFWKSRGLENGRWLPPFVLKSLDDLQYIQKKADVKFDVGYLGNLNTPNNIEGIRWFITNVLPLLATVIPDIKVVIGGSNPEPALRKLCSENNNITFIENPECSFTFYSSTAVLVNPIFKGSGVKIKSVEMLFTDKPVVTTMVGAEGIPENAKECFYIADTPDVMAEKILYSLKKVTRTKGSREQVREYFNPSAITKVIQDIEGFLKR